MDKPRIFKIIAEAEAELAVLDEVLDSGNKEAAKWTFTTLGGVFQDLQRLAVEEPTPKEIDKEKLIATFQSALNAVEEGRASIGASEYRLTRSDMILLYLALADLREMINGGSQLPHSGSSSFGGA